MEAQNFFKMLFGLDELEVLSMSIVRVSRRENYKTISMVPLNDRRLSWAARGLLLHLLGQADGWQIIVSAFVNRGVGAGREKMYKLLQELQQLGYCRKKPRQKENGQMDGWEYEIFEEPISCLISGEPNATKSRLRQSRKSVVPNSASPLSVNSDTNNKLIKTNIKKITNGFEARNAFDRLMDRSWADGLINSSKVGDEPEICGGKNE